MGPLLFFSALLWVVTFADKKESYLSDVSDTIILKYTKAQGRQITETIYTGGLHDGCGSTKDLPTLGVMIISCENEKMADLQMQSISGMTGVKAVSKDQRVHALGAPMTDGQQQELLRQAMKHKRELVNASLPPPLLAPKTNLDYIPNDSRFDEQWGLYNTGQAGGIAGADISMLEAWEFFDSAGGNSEQRQLVLNDELDSEDDVVVCVIDTGVNYNHPDLANQMWENPNEIPGNGIDDDGNGIVDDIHGINAITGTGDPNDDNSHGSHCAGVINAEMNNGQGIAGIGGYAPNIKIMGAKFLSAQGSGFTSHALVSLEYALANGAQISSNSWGSQGSPSPALCAAIEEASAKGHLFIAAAGNDASDVDEVPSSPCTCPEVLCVASTGNTDRFSFFTNYGDNTVHVAAPGGDQSQSQSAGILSTVLGSGYAFFQGTSMACPHVSGLAALLKSFRSDLRVRDVRSIIESTVDYTDVEVVTGGRINAFAAIVGAREYVMPGSEEFYLSLEKLGYRKASERCEELDGRLLVIHDLQKLNRVLDWGLDLEREGQWLGAQRIDGIPVKYEWEDGTKVTLDSGFFNWAEGEPTLDEEDTIVICENTCRYPFDNECDDGGPGADYALCEFGTDCNDCGQREQVLPGEDCIMMVAAGEYYDERCNVAKRYICEFTELAGTQVPTPPTFVPTSTPTIPSVAPTTHPTPAPQPPTNVPTGAPSLSPTNFPTADNYVSLGLLDCENNGCDFVVEGSTVGSPNEIGNPSGEDIYAFRIVQDGELEFSTCSPRTDYDTYLRLYRPCIDPLACDAEDLIEVAYNDDSPCSINGLFSQLMVNLDAYVQYYLVVEGYSSREGSYDIHFSYDAEERPSVEPSTYPTASPSASCFCDSQCNGYGDCCDPTENENDPPCRCSECGNCNRCEDDPGTDPTASPTLEHEECVNRHSHCSQLVRDYPFVCNTDLTDDVLCPASCGLCEVPNCFEHSSDCEAIIAQFPNFCLEVPDEVNPCKIACGVCQTAIPTMYPTGYPTGYPSYFSSEYPISVPTSVPTEIATQHPTKTPTRHPTKTPTRHPTKTPTQHPTKTPTQRPTKTPTQHPTKTPTQRPTKTPTISPTSSPTSLPPTSEPTDEPSEQPIGQPTASPIGTVSSPLQDGNIYLNINDCTDQVCTFSHNLADSEDWEYKLGNSSPEHRIFFRGENAGFLAANTCSDGTSFRSDIRLYRRPFGSTSSPGRHLVRGERCEQHRDGVYINYDMASSADGEDYEYILIVEPRKANIEGDDYVLELSLST